MKPDLITIAPRPTTTRLPARCAPALLALPLWFAAACVSPDSADQAAPPTATADQALTSGCDVLRPYAWDQHGTPCFEGGVRRTLHLAVGQSATFCSKRIIGMGTGCVTITCNADGGWTESNKTCRPNIGGSL